MVLTKFALDNIDSDGKPPEIKKAFDTMVTILTKDLLSNIIVMLNGAVICLIAIHGNVGSAIALGCLALVGYIGTHLSLNLVKNMNTA